MEEQQRIQPLMPERNGRNPQLSLPIYAPMNEDSPAQEWNLRQLLAVVRRRAIAIGGVAIACCAATWIWTLTRQSVYEGNFALLVEPITAESKLSGLSEIPGTNANTQGEGLLDYQTQILVLRSPELLVPIVKIISVRYPDVNYGSLLDNLNISRFGETKILQVSYHDSDPQKVKFVLERLSQGFLKYSLQQQQTNLRQGIKFVSAQLPQLQGRVNSLQFQLQRFREQHDLTSPDNKAGLLYEKYAALEMERLEIQKELAAARKFYAALQSKSGAQLALQAETQSLNQSSAPQLAASPSQNSIPTEAVPKDTPTSETGTDVSSSPQETQSQQSNISVGALQRRSGSPEAQSDAPIYQSLVSQLRSLETEIAANSTIYREDSPLVQSLKRKRESLLPVLKQEAARALGNKLVSVANQISLLEVQEAKNAQALASLNQLIKGLPNLARQYTDLQRELGIATESLNRFLERRELLQIENAQKEIPWQLIAPPGLPGVPIFPDVPRFLMLGVVASILAGLGAALLLEKMDNKFHSPDELKEMTKLPMLGVIPFHKNLGSHLAEGETNQREQNSRSRRNRNAAYGYNYFPFLESFRSLHTNIGFLSSDTPVHSFVISSSVHAEGKSTIAAYLAQAAAAMGRRVLLVDADLRLPQVHRILKLSNDTGLSNAISTNVPVTDLIQRSPAWENLFILTAGAIPPDPTKLLSSHKMRNIMEQLRQQFDLVIYDTPPMLGLADASLIAPHTAGIAVVTRMDKTDRTMISQTLDQLKLSRTQILGAICNGVKDYKATTSYYQYYYQPRTQSAG
jgi:capsular exopolysaccharide synthesis family protein